MRKQVLALLLALVTVLSCLAVGVAAIGDQEEAVVYTESILSGDPAAADGLTVSVRYGLQHLPHWFVDHTFGQQDVTDTVFRYYAVQPELDVYEDPYMGLELYITGDPFFAWDWDWLLSLALKNGEFPELLGAYKALYDATPTGSITHTYVRFADYCEYYPLSGYVSTAQGITAFYPYSGDRDQASKAFGAYFRIPVLEDDRVQMIVDKQERSSVDASNPRSGADYYEMRTVSTSYENTVYFTIDAHTHAGALVDTSLIPGGYGLYAFACGENGAVDYDSLTTLRPLDITHYPQQMMIDEEYGHLLYLSTKDSDWYLTVIDLATMQTLQQLRILDAREDKWQWHRIEEDFIIAVTGGEAIDIYRQNEQGLYDFCYTVPLDEKSTRYFDTDMYYAEFAFDGERLAVATQAHDWVGDGSVTREERRRGFLVSVFSQEGLLYTAEHISSMEPPSGSSNVSVYAVDLTWQ